MTETSRFLLSSSCLTIRDASLLMGASHFLFARTLRIRGTDAKMESA